MSTGATAALAWLAEYAAHLDRGVEAVRSGAGLTAAFADRCQELDDAVRHLGGDALRQAASIPAGRDLLAALNASRARFEQAMDEGRATLDERLGDRARAKAGLHGYASTGQWLKSNGARFIQRTG